MENFIFWSVNSGVFVVDSWQLSSQLEIDVPGASPEGPNVRELQGTFTGLLKDQQLNWWFDGKKFFLDAIVFVLHICYCFLLEKQIFESCKWGRPRDPVAGRPVHQMMRRSGDVRGASVIHVYFKSNAESY